jgi:hypothetical protein
VTFSVFKFRWEETVLLGGERGVVGQRLLGGQGTCRYFLPMRFCPRSVGDAPASPDEWLRSSLVSQRNSQRIYAIYRYIAACLPAPVAARLPVEVHGSTVGR